MNIEQPVSLLKKYHDNLFAYDGNPESACLGSTGTLLLVATRKELICFYTDTGMVAWRKIWPEGTRKYSLKVVANMAKDEFGVYYGDDLKRFDIVDNDGNIIEEYSTPLFTEIYTAFAITNDQVIIANSFSWQAIKRETKEIICEQQFSIAQDTDRYDAYTRPYITQDGKYLAFVKRASTLCYDAFTGELLQTIEVDSTSNNGIAADIAAGTHYLCNVSDHKLVVRSLPSLDVVYTGKLHMFGNSFGKTYSVKGDLILCHTAADIALFDMSIDTQDKLYDYLWTYNSNREICFFHPAKPIIYALCTGGIEQRNMDDYSVATGRPMPYDHITTLYYSGASKSLVGWNGNDSILSAAYYIGQDLLPLGMNDVRLPRYDRQRQVAFGNQEAYFLNERSQFKFLKHSAQYKRGKYKFLSSQLEEVLAIFRGTLIGISDAKCLQQADIYGNILKTLVTDKKKIASQYYAANRAGTLWGVKSKLILVYDFNDNSLTEIKSKVAADCKVFFSQHEKEITIIDKSVAEIYNTLSKELIKTIKIKNELVDMAPDGTLLAITRNILTSYDAATGKKISEFPLDTAPLAMATGDNKLFITDNARAIYAYSTPWQKTVAGKTTLPQMTDKLTAAELATLITNINGADIVTDDIPALRNILLAHEQHVGITPDHYRITSELMTGDWQLRHNFEIYNEIKASCASPDGKYLLYGSIADTGNWDEGGEFMLIEKETGRCVHSRKHVFGGIGWYDNEDYFKFSPDGTRLAFLFNGNTIGVTSIHHFDFSVVNFDVTDGASKPPEFEWLDNDNLAIGAYHKERIGYFICPVERDGSCYIGDLEYIVTGTYDENDKLVPVPGKQFPSAEKRQAVVKPDEAIIPGYPFDKDVIKANPAAEKELHTSGTSYSFPVNANGQWHWLLATPTGNIICPDTLVSQLDDYVHMVFSNRYAWFYRWASPQVFTIFNDWKQAADKM